MTVTSLLKMTLIGINHTFDKNITRNCSARVSLRVQKRRKHEERKGKNAKAQMWIVNPVIFRAFSFEVPNNKEGYILKDF